MTSGVMEALDDAEYSGDLISLLQDGENFVRHNTKKRWKRCRMGVLRCRIYRKEQRSNVL